jgi:hypothetical protein
MLSHDIYVITSSDIDSPVDNLSHQLFSHTFELSTVILACSVLNY